VVAGTTAPSSTGTVSSFNGRTGAVTPASGDYTTATGVIPTSTQIAGKNAIINGDFNVWQRGTTFSPSAGTKTYTADRFLNGTDGSATVTATRQTFTPGTAPVAGYEGTYYLQAAITGTSGSMMIQRIEDVRKFAGQTVTLSYWANATTSTGSFTPFAVQNFGTGGSGGVSTNATSSITIGTSGWTRYQTTINIPSISGKTIGDATNNLEIYLYYITVATTVTIWGVQLEAGSTATQFTTATGTVQGELAACQRYFYGNTFGGQLTLTAQLYSSTNYSTVYMLPVPMRILPSITFGLNTYNDSNAQWFNTTTSGAYTTGIAVQSNQGIRLQYSNASLFGLVNLGYLQASAEL
jgi:hypothetical protein